MIVTAEGMKYEELHEEWTPVKLVEVHNVLYSEWLMETKSACVSFKGSECAKFDGPGSFVVLDFGKELCGGIRMVTRDAKGMVKWRLTFGESLTEAYASIGEKNATNDHSPRDMEVVTGMMSDLTFGQTGFRFVRVELVEGEWAMLQSIFAVSILIFLVMYIKRELLEGHFIENYEQIMNTFDAIGLGIFTVVGIQTTITVFDDSNIFLLIFVGVITSVGGGVLRDVLTGSVPFVFVKHIYASASLAGAVLYVILRSYINDVVAMILSMVAVISIRILAARYRWNLPRIYNKMEDSLDV